MVDDFHPRHRQVVHLPHHRSARCRSVGRKRLATTSTRLGPVLHDAVHDHRAFQLTTLVTRLPAALLPDDDRDDTTDFFRAGVPGLSFDGGRPEFVESVPSLRRNRAISAACCAIVTACASMINRSCSRPSCNSITIAASSRNDGVRDTVRP
jgi:hypothetical protein